MNTLSAITEPSTSPVVVSDPNAEPVKMYCPLVSSFLDYLKNDRHFSDYTVKSYGADLFQFCQFIRGEIGRTYGDPARVGMAFEMLDDALRRCEPVLIRDFLGYLAAQNYTKSTTARKLATLRSFYKFLIRRGQVSVNPLSTIRTPKQEKRLPKCLELDQVQKLLDAPGDADLLSLRDKAMLEVLYSSGIRVSELVELEIGDIDLTEGVLRIRGKGKKDRLTPIGSQAITAINRYFEMRKIDGRTSSATSQRVFLNKHGEPLSTRSVRRKLDKYLVIAGLDPGISPHTLRHSFAAHLLGNGVDLKSVQELLGHQSLSTTQVYTQLSARRAREVYENQHRAPAPIPHPASPSTIYPAKAG